MSTKYLLAEMCWVGTRVKKDVLFVLSEQLQVIGVNVWMTHGLKSEVSGAFHQTLKNMQPLSRRMSQHERFNPSGHGSALYLYLKEKLAHWRTKVNIFKEDRCFERGLWEAIYVKVEENIFESRTRLAISTTYNSVLSSLPKWLNSLQEITTRTHTHCWLLGTSTSHCYTWMEYWGGLVHPHDCCWWATIQLYIKMIKTDGSIMYLAVLSPFLGTVSHRSISLHRLVASPVLIMSCFRRCP